MRKLGRTAEARMAMIRTQASELLWYGVGNHRGQG